MINATIRCHIVKKTVVNSSRVVPNSDPPVNEQIQVSEVILESVRSEKIKDENGSEIPITHVPRLRMKLGGLFDGDGLLVAVNQQFDITFKELA